MKTRLESAYGLFTIADNKEKENDMRRAHMAYESIIVDFMYLSFSEFSSIHAVKNWLLDHPLEQAASRFIAITEDVLKMPRTEWTRYFQSGNYLLIAFSHFFAAIDQPDRARFFAQTATEPELFATPFWTEYAKTLWAMMQGRSYTPMFGKLKRVERFWLVYVNLMQAVMQQEGIDAAIAGVDRQFAVRNSDMNLHEDAYMIDGTGEFPLKFDFRKAGLLAAEADIKLRILK